MLGRPADQRKALLRGLTTQLIREGRVTTTKADPKPAWEQDLENTSERGGRRQDKEGIMEKLRKLGYM